MRQQQKSPLFVRHRCSDQTWAPGKICHDLARWEKSWNIQKKSYFQLVLDDLVGIILRRTILVLVWFCWGGFCGNIFQRINFSVILLGANCRMIYYRGSFPWYFMVFFRGVIWGRGGEKLANHCGTEVTGVSSRFEAKPELDFQSLNP